MFLSAEFVCKPRSTTDLEVCGLNEVFGSPVRRYTSSLSCFFEIIFVFANPK